MKRRLAVILFFSGAVNAAQLSTLNGVELLAINGKSAKNYGETATKSLELVPGKYQIVARFEDNLKRGSKNSLYTSRPYVLDITLAESDLVLFVPPMRFESQAAAFFRNPVWKLKDISTDKSMQVFAVELEGTGFGAFRNMETAVAHHNQKNGIIFDNGNVQNLEQMLVSSDGKVDMNADAGKQLQFWYTKADDKQKKAFRRWIIDQD